MKYVGRFLVFMFSLLVLPQTYAEEVNQAGGKVMIVLDASGSMWGQIAGEPKISIARRVIHDLLTDWDSSMAVGLTAYGHRRKGDCTDIEVLVPVDQGGPESVLDAVNKLQPKGKTPLSDAVRTAAESLKYTEEHASVILVSDGKETCDVDPCALGKQLEEQGVDFTVHVIGFDVKKSEQVGLNCLAENTGGRFATASDAGSLKAALWATVEEVKQQVVKPVAPEPKAVVIGIKLRALLAEGGAEYDGEINWAIYAADTEAANNSEPLFQKHRGKSGHVFRDLKPGNYVVLGEFSDARHIHRRFEIALEDEESMTQDLVFNVGKVRFDGLLKEDGEAFPGDLTWNIFEPKQDLSGKRKKLTYFHRRQSGGIYLLPAGDWFVYAELSDWLYINTSKQITIEAGGEEAHDFLFNSGVVRFDNVLAEEQDPFMGDIDYYILTPGKDLSGKRKQLTYAYRKQSGYLINLPAGQWYISAELSDWDHIRTSREIMVEPGGEEAHIFDFGVGRVRIDVTLEGAPFDGETNWTIYQGKADLSGKRKQITYVNRKRSGVVTPLLPGDYLLRAEHADQRSMTGEIPFTLKEGEEKSVVVNLKSSE